MINIRTTRSAATLLFVTTLFMLVATPTYAFRDEAVDRNSFSVSEQGVGVYELTVRLGGWSEDLYLPVVGERGLPFASRKDRFGFTIESGYPLAESDAGAATALIVAPFEIVDGYYKIPARTLASFKIIALLAVDETEGNTYRFRITDLPFLQGTEKVPGHFSQGETKYFETNYEALYFERDPE